MEYLTIYKSGKYKTRLGNKNQDGGYIVVDLPGEYDGFISGGIGNDVSFESDFINTYKVNCTAFDNSIDTLPYNNDKIKFVKKGVGKTNSYSTTDLIEYTTGNNMFLKLDVEGFEFKVLPALISNNMLGNFKQMVIEFHTPEDINKHPYYYSSQLLDVTNEDMGELFNSINKTHTLVHLHGNPVPGTHKLDDVIIPNVFECTFIRNDFLDKKDKNVKPVPTVLDRPNLPGYKEIDLNYWPFVN